MLIPLNTDKALGDMRGKLYSLPQHEKWERVKEEMFLHDLFLQTHEATENVEISKEENLDKDKQRHVMMMWWQQLWLSPCVFVIKEEFWDSRLWKVFLRNTLMDNCIVYTQLSELHVMMTYIKQETKNQWMTGMLNKAHNSLKIRQIWMGWGTV